jgi:hypothetical protein
MRSSRFPAWALLGALALAGLAGCTDDGDPWDETVAAYVGEVTITEAEVDAVIDQLRAAIGGELERELARLAEEMDEEELAAHREERFGQLEDQVAVTRVRVIEMRILTTAADEYIAEQGLAPPDVPQTAYDQQANDLGLPADHVYVRLVTDFLATLTVLQGSAEPAAPTEADQREVYDNLVAEGLTTVPFEEARAVLTQDLMGQQVGMRNLLADVVDGAEVRVSPAYDLVYRVPVPVGSAESWLALPLGEAG